MARLTKHFNNHFSRGPCLQTRSRKGEHSMCGDCNWYSATPTLTSKCSHNDIKPQSFTCQRPWLSTGRLLHTPPSFTNVRNMIFMLSMPNQGKTPLSRSFYQQLSDFVTRLSIMVNKDLLHVISNGYKTFNPR